MTDDELINEIEAQRGLIIAVATGGPRIQEVNAQYVQRRTNIATELFRQAALCAEASTSVVNVIAVLSGRRDRQE
jgi:hypothetical protein